MLKVMRKYNRVILVLGGTLLMIAFLIPQAIRQLGQARLGRAVGTMDGHKVTLAQYDVATRELRALEEFFGYMDRQFPLTLADGHETAHWMLLTREAERAGLVAGADEGASLLPVLAEQLVRAEYQRVLRQSADQWMAANPDIVRQSESQALMHMANAKARGAGTVQFMPEQFDLAVAKLRGVNRLLDSYRFAERLSDRQTAAIAKQLADTVLIDSAFLAARRLADESLTPTPEQLRAHFDRFRDIRPGEGEYPFGYKLPPRAKVEWIELNRPAIAATVQVSLVDATKHWQENRDRFPGLFEAERDKVEAELRDAETQRVMDTAEALVRSAILTAARPLEKSGEYRVLPAEWAQEKPDFIKLADDIQRTLQDQHGVSIPTPAVFVRDGGWLDGAMLSELPGIGSATVRFGREEPTFPQVVLSVRELVGETSLGLQVGLPSSSLVADGRDGSRYYFTVLAAAAESVAASPDEYLYPDRLVGDWRSLRRYEELAAAASSYEQQVVTGGLEAFAKGFGTMVPKSTIEGLELTEAQDRVTIVRNSRVLEDRTSGLMNAENSQEVIKQVRAKGATIDPMAPIEGVPLAERVVVTPIPSRLGVLVSQINGVEPLTRELLPIFADYAVRVHQTESVGGTGIPFPFRFEILRQRHGFSMKKGEEPEAGEPDGTPTQPAPGADGDESQDPTPPAEDTQAG